MIRLLVPLLLLFSSVAAVAAKPRFLGPPVKKPADAGTGDAGVPEDAGVEPHGQRDAALLKAGLAQVDAPEPHDLCTVVKSVVRTSVDGFKATRGAKHEDSATRISWTAPVKLPGSSVCKVIEYKNGDPPFYGCEMHATSCKLTEKKFLTLVKDVSTCLDAQPRMEDDGKKRTARLHKGGVPVRATFTRGADCQFRFFVEPLGKK